MRSSGGGGWEESEAGGVKEEGRAAQRLTERSLGALTAKVCSSLSAALIFAAFLFWICCRDLSTCWLSASIFLFSCFSFSCSSATLVLAS